MRTLIFLKILFLVVLSSCSKEITENVKTGDLVNILNKETNSIETLFGFIDHNEDIKLTFHHYDNGADGRFKLMKYANKDIYSNIELGINGRNIKFDNKSSVLRDDDALFLNNNYGSKTKVKITLDDSKKLEYELDFPKKISINSSTQSFIIPDKTKITWDRDENSESLVGVLIEYHDEKKNLVTNNHKVLKDNGSFVISEDLFKGIPDKSKVFLRVFKGKYLKDMKENLRIIIFSVDYSTEYFTTKYPSL